MATLIKYLVAQHGALQSMSWYGNCYDKAYIEYFCSRFKAKLLEGDSFPCLTEAKLEASYLIVYNYLFRPRLLLT